MKTYISNVKIAALALLLTVATSVKAIANDGDKDKKASVSYVGNLNELPVYRLSLHNADHSVYYVSVTDSEGNRIYNEKISGVNIVRNYQFNGNNDNEYTFTFTIADSKGKALSVYNISKVKKVIEQVAINEVK
ncbi:hypothetical protein GCM10027051_06510 [Niabella terrae]